MICAAIDFETTGTVKGCGNEPWQIGIVTFEPETGRICEMWETYLRVAADREFSRYAPGRWAKIRDELAAAPTFYDVWGEISSRIVARPLVAHNAGTERTILTHFAPLTPFGPWRDTLKILKARRPGMASYALGDAVAAFGLAPQLEELFAAEQRTFHDALYDAAATALLFCRLG